MRLVITGGLGHIGSKLIRYFLHYYPNYEIVVIDNLETQRHCSLFNLPKNKKFNFIELDVSKPEIQKYIETNDVVIHLAAQTNMSKSISDNEFKNYNLKLTKNITETSLNKNAFLIFISSTSVYTPKDNFIDENCKPVDMKPTNPYAQSKLKEEQYIFKKYNLLKKFTILRFGTIYGISEGMRFHTAVNKFCWQASFGLPLTVWKTAFKQKRPYLELFDACRAISHIIDNKIFNGDTYNVLTDNTSVENIIDKIQKLKPDLNINFVDDNAMNNLSYEVCNKKFKESNFKYFGDMQKEIKTMLSVLGV